MAGEDNRVPLNLKRSDGGRRRAVLAVLAVLAAPAWAQAPSRMVRIGFLIPGPDTHDQKWMSLLKTGLAELGYVEGRNLTMIVRRPAGLAPELAAAVAEMARQRPDLIVAFGHAALAALKKAGRPEPLVMTDVIDPALAGFMVNPSRPGGNVTGPGAGDSHDIVSQQIETLRALQVKLPRLTVLMSDSALQAPQLKAVQQIAKGADLKVHSVVARDLEELGKAFAGLPAAGKGAVLVLGGYPQSSLRQQIAQLGLRHKVPVVAAQRAYAEDGALFSIGADPVQHFQMAARYADKILNGARPADMPVEQPARLELVINGNTVAALGLSVPHLLRLRADEVI
jgi:putative ABC transport system substrate-binding protein